MQTQTNMIMKTDAYRKCHDMKDHASRYSWRIHDTTADYLHHHSLPPTATTNLVFFDLDNTLYPASTGISMLMKERIKLFLMQKMAFPEAEAEQVGARFYNDYGLAIKGCVKHFGVDPGLYDRFVDGGLPLERVLGPLQGQDRECISAVMGRRWVFTNAGRGHAERVLRILGITDLFEGVVHCDYEETDFPAKPDVRAYQRALECAIGVHGYNDVDGGCGGKISVYFIDDSSRNVEAGKALGWRTACLDELDDVPSENAAASPIIRSLVDLPQVFPELYYKQK